jgi:hypothetical protein
LAFADQCILGPLARLDLAAGKLPQARHRLAFRTLREQHAIVRVHQRDGYDEGQLHER